MKFDFNDGMTQEEAGAAVKSFTYYPIQFLAEVDNACRVPIGVLVSATDLGLCQIFEPTPKAEEERIDPGSPGCPNTCPPRFVQNADCSCTQGTIP
ncbi:MAG: hypothetical protein JETCAE01_02020 [Anaerolineaceae bacterium]|nr:MAG: hypothetical protein JETCAE01_02020 [Anaerolineaceae bacterium]